MKRSDIKTIAFLSVDNTRTFEDKSLNELYVNEWEQAAIASKELVEACQYYKITMINVLEKHPIGHISLAANYKDKKPFESISYEEVKDWTEEENGIGERAEFTLDDLKTHLSKVQVQMLRPDHSIKDTNGIELTQPLQAEEFDIEIIKWTNPSKEAYSWFDETTLDEELQKRNKKILLIGWVATDYCVGQTALDGQQKWYEVYLVSEAVRWVTKDTTDTMIKTLLEAGVKQISTKELYATLAKYPQKK